MAFVVGRELRQRLDRDAFPAQLDLEVVGVAERLVVIRTHVEEEPAAPVPEEVAYQPLLRPLGVPVGTEGLAVGCQFRQELVLARLRRDHGRNAEPQHPREQTDQQHLDGVEARRTSLRHWRLPAPAPASAHAGRCQRVPIGAK
jgi:hypothetical protein